jgi:hypothetical protein
MNRIILIIAAIVAGYAVGKRCARARYAPRIWDFAGPLPDVEDLYELWQYVSKGIERSLS